jgi:nucleoside-diphosphate-sugar epimerase
MKKILITGSTGYIGSALLEKLIEHSRYELILPVRSLNESLPKSCRQVLIEDIDDLPSSLFTQVDVVVHLAGKAHDLSGAQELAIEFRRINFVATKKLAAAALAARVRKFIYLSSIKVCGHITQHSAFTEQSISQPSTPYAASKWDAENALTDIVSDSGMELVIVRPPLVYSGSSPGNFSRLMQLVSLRVPLPFRNVRNKRSIIALENLVDFIGLCIDQSTSEGNLFLVSDGEEFSTAEICHYLGEGMGRKAILFSLPLGLVRRISTVVGKRYVYTQLFESLVVNSSKARDNMAWNPPISTKDALIKAGQEYSQATNGVK